MLPCSNENDQQPAAQRLLDLTESLLYPRLTADIGTEAPDDLLPNSPFRARLDELLHQLFRQLHEFDERPEADLPIVHRVRLTLLYCEQTAKHADFGTSDPQLQDKLGDLHNRIDQWLSADGGQRAELDEAVLMWYKERVTTAQWRREAGATLGLVRYAEISTSTSSSSLTLDAALFYLSAGHLLIEHFERSYKELAFSLFNTILTHLSAADLQRTQMASPIFAASLQQVAAIKEAHIQPPMWRCLCACLDLKHPVNGGTEGAASGGKWNARDDCAAALLQRLAFENDAEVRALLIGQIPRVFAGWPETEDEDEDEDQDEKKLAVLRQSCRSAGSCLAACRWTRKLAKILPYHVSCCFGPATDVRRHLRTVHRAYLSTLFAMPVALCAPALRELLDELPGHLVQLMWHHRSDEEAARKRLAAEVCGLLASLGEQIGGGAERSGDGDDRGNSGEVVVAAGGLSDEWRQYFGGRAETLAAIVERLGDEGDADGCVE